MFRRILPLIDCLGGTFPRLRPCKFRAESENFEPLTAFRKTLNVAWFYTNAKNPVNIKVRYILC